MKKIVIAVLFIFSLIALPLAAQSNTQQVILNKLSSIEARLQVVENNQKMILREMDKRFEQVDKRFEQVDMRFEQVNNRFGDMMNYIIILVAVFASMTGLTIGFALWDRRSALRPVKEKVSEVEERLKKTDKVDNELISVLREYAGQNKRFAEIIKGFNIF